MNHVSDAGYELEFTSIVLGNDPRLVKTSRKFKVTGSTLEYYKSMSTNTTQEPIMLPHLHSILTKID